MPASARQQRRNRGNTSTSGNRHWRPVNGLDQHSSQTPEQRCYDQKNWSEEALLHSCCAHNLAASQARSTADCAVKHLTSLSTGGSRVLYFEREHVHAIAMQRECDRRLGC